MKITPLVGRPARRWLLLLMVLLLNAEVMAEASLPTDVVALIKKNRVAQSQIGIIVQRLDGDGDSIINHRPHQLFNPASITKVITMLAAIDQLGPTHQWQTTIATSGKIKGDTLVGDLYLIGGGDPDMKIEEFLYLLSGLRHRGIRHIQGDVIIDDSIFSLSHHNPATFDGAGLKPYNVGAAGLVVNFKVQQIVLLPTDSGLLVYTDPPNDHFTLNSSVKMRKGRCRNWRGKLRERLQDNGQQAIFNISGTYAKSCGEQSFYLAVLNHPAYVAGIFSGLWKQLGGQWQGKWRRGRAPETVRNIVTATSQPLSSTLMGMNKYSNNVIARNLFLSLSPEPVKTLPSARQSMQQWLQEQGVSGAFIDNGSGLSRDTRITPAQMAQLLTRVWNHRYRSEMIASLPILGVDGTLRKRLLKQAVVGEGHLKTGSLANVKAMSGFLRDKKGRPLLVVFFTTGTASSNAKSLQDDLLKWVYQL